MTSTLPLTPVQSRSLGALLGVHAGDSLGATLEFNTHDWILQKYPHGLRDIVGGGPFDWPPGHATDDTDMTRAVLLAYRDRHELVKSKEDNASGAEQEEESSIVYLAANHFLEWFNGDPWPDRTPNSRPVDIGGATHTGLTNYASSHNPYTSGAGPGSAGNGSLMRCIPTALFEPDREARIRDSMLISAVTHNDPRCTVACAAYNEMVAELVKGVTPQAAVSAGEDVVELIKSRNSTDQRLLSGADDVLGAIAVARTLSIPSTAQNGPSKSLPGKGSGFVLESLILAVAAVLDTRGFEDVLVDVVRVGKDTDTNGAVAGGLLGARDGIEGIPAEWRKVLQFEQEFTRIALDLLADQ